MGDTTPSIIAATVLDEWHYHPGCTTLLPWMGPTTALDDTLTALDGWHLPSVYNASALDG